MKIYQLLITGTSYEAHLNGISLMKSICSKQVFQHYPTTEEIARFTSRMTTPQSVKDEGFIWPEESYRIAVLELELIP